jgi:hypothetical protein
MGRAKWLVLVMAVAAITSCAHRPPRYVDASVLAQDEALSFVVLYPEANGACKVGYPPVTELKSSAHNKVSWQVVNLCEGDPEVTIDNFTADTTSTGCAGTSGDPFDEKSGKVKPGKKGIAPATFKRAQGKDSGCWKYDITVTENGQQVAKIDPMVRIDR